MAIKSRFSIRAIFLVTTLFVVVLAYAQWRRQSILKQISRLEEAGVSVVSKRSWWTSAWLPTPQLAQLDAKEVAAGSLQIGAATYSFANVDQRLKELRDQLRQLGVRRFIVHAEKTSGAQHQILFDLSTGEESNAKFRLSDFNAPSPLEPGK